MTDIDRRPQLQALVDKKGKPLHVYALAMEHRKHGDLELAVSTFHRVLDVDDDYHAALFMAAQVEEEREDFEASRKALSRGIEIAVRVGDSHAEGEMRSMLDLLPDD